MGMPVDDIKATAMDVCTSTLRRMGTGTDLDMVIIMGTGTGVDAIIRARDLEVALGSTSGSIVVSLKLSLQWVDPHTAHSSLNT